MTFKSKLITFQILFKYFSQIGNPILKQMAELPGFPQYSLVPNRRGDWNKRVGWKNLQNIISGWGGIAGGVGNDATI